MKITDRRGSARADDGRPSGDSGLILARGHSDIRTAQKSADDALARGRAWSHSGMDAAASTSRRATLGSSSISPASQKPRDLRYYMERNTQDYQIESMEGLFRLQEICRKLYIWHPMIGTAVDIYSKWPLVGMEFRSQDEDLVQFYSELMFDDLNYEDFLVKVGREYWTTGEAIALGTWNETLRIWENDELVKTDDVRVHSSSFLKDPLLSMRLPEEVRRIIQTQHPPEQYRALAENYPELIELQRSTQASEFFHVSSHLMKHMKFDADTFFDRGIPIMTRGIRAVLQEEMLNTAQDSIADRLSTPLLMVRLGATATELGTQNPWIPNEDELANFESMLNAAMAADFRVMTTHFGVKAESVFGREAMPNFDNDFERIGERILQVFGLSKTMLSGAGSGQTYAADAMNRDLVTQMMSSHQRMIKRFVRERMLVVAEAQEHYDYEERNGNRYVKYEEVLVMGEDGHQYIEERPKLLVPDLHLKPMSLADETKKSQEIESLRASGVPISHRRRLTNLEIDLDEEVEASREERIMLALEEQKTRRETYLALKKEGLPIPQDLREDFDPMPEEPPAPAATPGEPNPVTPGIGEVEDPHPNLAPVAQDAAPGGAGDAPLPLPPGDAQEGRQRPMESDEMRADMPKPVAVRSYSGNASLTEGPSHMKRKGVRVRGSVASEDMQAPADDAELTDE